MATPVSSTPTRVTFASTAAAAPLVNPAIPVAPAPNQPQPSPAVEPSHLLAQPDASLNRSGFPPLTFPHLVSPSTTTNLRPAENVSAVAIKLPAFWPGDPEVWFAQAEAQFRLRRITDETTKFTHVVASLTKEYAVEVRDLLLSPPPTVPYTTLKEALIRRTSDSESSKLQQLLSTADLGDQKPSQLLRNMERLVGGKSIDAALFRQLFLQRLPRNVAMVLEATSTSVDLSTQAEIADKLMQLNDQPPLGRTVNAVQAPPTSSVSADVAALRAEVAALTDTLKQLHTSRGRHHSQSFRGSRSRSRGRSTSPSRQRGELCFYHEKFGANARKCRPPCAFQPPTHATGDSGNATARN